MIERRRLVVVATVPLTIVATTNKSHQRKIALLPSHLVLKNKKLVFPSK